MTLQLRNLNLVASLISGNSTVKSLLRPTAKEWPRLSITGPLWRVHRWRVDCPRKGLIMLETFPWHDVQWIDQEWCTLFTWYLTPKVWVVSWWRQHMEAFSVLLTLCEGIHRWPVDSLHNGSVAWTFGVSFDVSFNRLLDKQSSSWWFETPRQSCNVTVLSNLYGLVGNKLHNNQCYLGDKVKCFFRYCRRTHVLILLIRLLATPTVLSTLVIWQCLIFHFYHGQYN